ncbi:autophagy-related protein 27 [Coniochaeta sp. 2T2.1]|nr:autophagy-related protein 27 [Coniochaeta sp. 2T2.1]
MRLSSRSSPEQAALPAALVALLLLAPSSVWAASFLHCGNLVVDEHKFDFSPLKGPHTITTSEFHPPTYSNTTYTLDLCAYLKRKDDVKKGDECPNGTRVCAIKHLIDPRKDPKENDSIEAVIPIAGNLAEHGGKAFDITATRLKSSDSVSDSKKEGVRLEMKGGVYEGREQKAVVELVCDKERTGTEGEWESVDRYDPDGEKEKEKREEDKKEEGAGDKKDDEKKGDDEVGWSERQLKKEGAALVWEGYNRQDGTDTLQLTWYTKYACESSVPEKKPEDASSHWGFFTWLVVIGFVATAAYLIFGSWLNYNRYGARGWDLLPHGDTLRDLPYLLKDWMRRFLNTVQGSGSRGGYSAV